ncbi:MAG: carboxypeptidase regulatory-like domain-containing protein [Pedobacter sp.]|nr:MAG: carboxypeptidase regulatory-like domain-containing protein [Pedobacter sp.]
MKNVPAQVTIEKPCSQNWEEMEKRDGLNFCQACNKCVIDFTGYSNAEIIKTLASASSEVCGRLTKNQLAQLNYHLAVVPAGRSWMKYLGVLAIGVSIFAQSPSATAASFSVNTEIIKDSNNTDEKKPVKIGKINGRVLGADKKPLKGIKLVISNTKYSALTDDNGRYEIKFTQGIDAKNNVLLINSSKFEAEIAINFSSEKQVDLFAQDRNLMIMGGMGYMPRKTNNNITKS